jgi:DNA-binding IclR family transcriptional regulator
MAKSVDVIAIRTRKDAGAPVRKAAQGVAAVERAFAILGAFRADDTGSVSLAELAVRTGLYKSTILRIAQSLIRHRFLQRTEDGRYQIGSAALMLAAHYQRSLHVRDVLLPIMHELSQASGESVAFYVRENDMRVCLFRVDSTRAIRYHVREGDVLPLEKGSGGRVLLAYADARGEPYDSIRRDFHYISLGDREAEIAGISAPVFDMNGRLAGALTLAGPTSRFDRAFADRMRVPLLTAAARATMALGGDAAALEAAASRIDARPPLRTQPIP